MSVRILQEADVDHFKVLCRHSPGQTEEIHDKAQSGQPNTPPTIHAQNVTALHLARFAVITKARHEALFSTSSMQFTFL